MTLKEFYDIYTLAKAAAEKESLNKERQKLLMEFQQHILNLGFVKKKGLKFHDKVLMQDPKNLHSFHFRLIGFLLANIQEKNADQEPYLSIRIYLHLQERGMPALDAIKPSTFTYEKIYTFSYWTSELKKILDSEIARLRDPSYLHGKFLRYGKKSKPKSSSEALQIEIEARVNAVNDKERERPIAIDGYSARSVIMALHRSMPTIMIKLAPRPGDAPYSGKPIYFQIADTLIKWLPMPASQNGRVFIEMAYWNASKTRLINHSESSSPDRELLHRFPYDQVAERLLALENKLIGDPKNLMALMVQKFSSKIEPFAMTEFKSVDLVEIHFLNAFSFLTQIVEIARYLVDNVSLKPRAIEAEPLSIALAIAKTLKQESKINWEELYTNAPKAFVDKYKGTITKWDKAAGKYKSVPPNSSDIRGLDPTSGVSLAINHELTKHKMAELDVRNPSYLGNVLSASSVHTLFRTTYGGDSESDSNDSAYSLKSSYLDFKFFQENKVVMAEQLNRWASAAAAVKDVKSLELVADTTGFITVDAGGGGNCFFHAVVHQLNELGINEAGYEHESLRQAALDYVLNHWDTFIGFIADPNDFITRMSTTGEWADHEIIAATALRLELRIRIHRNDGEEPTIINGDAAQEINLGYYVGAHYVSFLPDKMAPKP